jgi:hypothetical protein
LNPTTGTFSFQSVETFFGGTGHYEGVTGSVQISGTELYFVFDPVSGGGFGSQTGTFSGTIIFP